MAELVFSREDIENLAEKLSEILADANLRDGEKRLLLAILELAAENVYQPVSMPETVAVDELRVQIIQAFVPDQVQEFRMYAKKPPHKIGGHW